MNRDAGGIAGRAMLPEHFGPTAIHSIGLELNGNRYYVKRDDLIPVSFGGNKARKAVLFFRDIDAVGANCVVTYGSSSSNHCRVVASLAASRRMPCHIVSPEGDRETQNSRLVRFLGAEITRCSLGSVSNTIEAKVEELKTQGYRPYVIEGGGHGNIGTLAYVRCFEEIVEQERALGVHFDYIFHASGTGTTQAGLICGQTIFGGDREIVGISCARRHPHGATVVADCVLKYLHAVGQSCVAAQRVNFVDDYVLGGYGEYNDEITATIREVFCRDGIPLDGVYTGKAFWGMKEFIRKNRIVDRDILFLHTGGTPLFFDHLAERLG